MTVSINFITLYVGGQPVQVVEGSQLHLIYAGLGATSQPPAAIPYVRPDPFPQYVHDEEIAGLLADAAVPATDPVVAGLVSNSGSATSVALRAALGLSVAATVSTNATLAANRHTPVDATSGARTMTLPTGQPESTRIIVEKVDSSTNAITVSGSIRGSAGTVSLVGQYETLSFLADSAGSWHPGPGHKTKAYLDSKYVPRGVNNVVVGNGGMANPLNLTDTALTAGAHINNPSVPFAGAFSAFAYFTGAEQPGAGSLQGGASEAYCALNGTVTQAVLGFEGIGVAVGDTADGSPQGSYPSVMGLQGTAFVQGDVSVTSLTAILARGPHDNGGGVATVDTAYSIRAQQPTIGTKKHTFYGEGRHTFAYGTSHSNVIEILGSASVKRWAVDGASSKWIGYATDGASERMAIDPADTPTNGRFQSDIFNSGSRHIALKWQGNLRWSVDEQGYVVWADALRQTTVGAAGAAAALPATPTTYIKVKTTSGTTLVIPAYLAA